jgi:hypothetical protein
MENVSVDFNVLTIEQMSDLCVVDAGIHRHLWSDWCW